MQASYSQWTAFKAIFIAAFRSIIKSPSSIIFTVAFPLAFIFSFVYINEKNSLEVQIAVHHADSGHALMAYLQEEDYINVNYFSEQAQLNEMLRHGKVDVVLKKEDKVGSAFIDWQILTLNEQNVEADYVEKILFQWYHQKDTPSLISNYTSEVKLHKPIDFILPGQLGFALLAASVFGTAFVFYNLRQSLVLKRFFTTPVYKSTIIIAECMARIVFQLIGVIIILIIGHYVLEYQLSEGWISVLNVFLLCLLALLTFMSFGFIVSSLARSEALIPPLSNIVVFPQFILAGTFFPIEQLPNWLNWTAEILPLTYLNTALRAVAFDGASLWEVRKEIGILFFWGLIGNVIAAKTFKWE